MPQTNAIFANVNTVKARMKAATVTSVLAEAQSIVKVEVQTPPTLVEVQPVMEAEAQTPPTPATTEVKTVDVEVITASGLWKYRWTPKPR